MFVTTPPYSKKKPVIKKRIGKDLIEKIILNLCVEQLADKNIDKLIKKITAISRNQEKSVNISRLTEALKASENQENALMQSLKECEFESVRKGIFIELDGLERSKSELEKDLAVEKTNHFIPTEEQLRAFFKALKVKNKEDIKTKRVLIDIFINAIYLYDDGDIRNCKITVIFNSDKRPITIENIPIDEINLDFEKQYEHETKVNGTSAKNRRHSYYFNGSFAVTMCL